MAVLCWLGWGVQATELASTSQGRMLGAGLPGRETFTALPALCTGWFRLPATWSVTIGHQSGQDRNLNELNAGGGPALVLNPGRREFPPLPPTSPTPPVPAVTSGSLQISLRLAGL